MSDQAAFETAIRANPQEATTWLVYADWLQERDADEEYCERLRRIGNALQSREPLPVKEWPLAELRQFFDIEHNERGYADYLDIAGRITGSEHTRLQGEYLRNHLDKKDDKNEALLPIIRNLTRERLGVSEEQLPDECLPVYNWRIDVQAGRVALRAIPEGFHCSGHADFSSCTQLTKVGAHFHAGNDAIFEDCAQLIHLPAETISVGGELHLPRGFSPDSAHALMEAEGLSPAAKSSVSTWLKAFGQGQGAGAGPKK